MVIEKRIIGQSFFTLKCCFTFFVITLFVATVFVVATLKKTNYSCFPLWGKCLDGMKMEVKTIEVANVKTETLKNLENVRPLPSTSLTPSPKGKARVGEFCMRQIYS